jgi:hypothetical protein
MKRVGPELKMPEMKVPPVLRDLYQDLRDRRLLPVLGLLLVAIVALPFLLSQSPEEEPVTVPPLGGESATGQEAAQLAVVQANPGIRDYRKRLLHRTAVDPFKQKFTKPVLKGAKLQSESSTSGGSSTSTSTTTETTETSEGGGIVEGGGLPGSGGGSGSHGNGHGGGNGNETESPGPSPNTKLYTYAIDIRIRHTEEQADGSVTMSKPEERLGVRPLTPLPAEKTPVVTVLGVNPENGNVLLMVSKSVTAAFGEAKCVAGTEVCELMEVEKGFPETLEYGPDHVRYKFLVLKVSVVPAGTKG